LFLPNEDVRDQQVFRIDDEWNRSDEKEKEDVLNNVFEKRERALRKAREALDQRYSQGTSPGAVGWLFYFAYENLNAAVNQANIQDSDVSEKLEELVDEFHEAVKIYDGDDVVEEYTPHDMLVWSEEAEDINRMPAPMRKVMDANGEKIQQLIGFAYSGTEAVTEGSSEEETKGPEG
jgi:hypothetical protein